MIGPIGKDQKAENLHMKPQYRQLFRSVLPLLAAFSLPALAVTAASPTSEPLVQESDLVYVGSFRLPEPTSSGDTDTFHFAGQGLAYNPANNSLFITGYGGLTAEVSIPTPVQSATLKTLPTATFIQQFADPTDGNIRAVNPTSKSWEDIGGYLVYGDQLYVSVYSYYDGTVSQIASHFARPLTLSANQVSGPYRVGDQYPGFVSGYMALVPPEWQATLGAPAVTGNCCLAIAGAQSNGPALSAFNPSSLKGPPAQTAATPLVGYPIQYHLGTGWSTQSDLYNGTTHISGVVFPVGTRSVLFFGLQGTGPFCYGPGTTDTSLVGQMTDNGHDPWCYDPTNASKGTHAYPYVSQIWAYDADDMLKVAQGKEAQYAIKPYGIWTLSLPFSTPNASYGFKGAAYDPQTNRIFLTQACADTSCSPIVDVFQISPGPSAPADIQVK